MPKKLQGTWSGAEGGAPTIIGANAVSFGDFKLKLINIVPGDEELNTLTVKWLANPAALVVDNVWKLVKFNGQQFLMDMNAECPGLPDLLEEMTMNKLLLTAATPDRHRQPDGDGGQRQEQMK